MDRILELAKQAGYVDKGSNATAYRTFDHERFAKLIVRECAQLANYNHWGINASAKILEHFNVV